MNVGAGWTIRLFVAYAPLKADRNDLHTPIETMMPLADFPTMSCQMSSCGVFDPLRAGECRKQIGDNKYTLHDKENDASHPHNNLIQRRRFAVFCIGQRCRSLSFSQVQGRLINFQWPKTSRARLVNLRDFVDFSHEIQNCCYFCKIVLILIRKADTPQHQQMMRLNVGRSWLLWMQMYHREPKFFVNCSRKCLLYPLCCPE